MSIEAKGAVDLGEEDNLTNEGEEFAKAFGAEVVATKELLEPEGNMEVEEKRKEEK